MGLMPPVSNSPTIQSDYETLIKDAQELIGRRDKLEQELRGLEDVLRNANVDMNTQLVDNAGFPRSEIDVHSIRNTRAMIIRLRNDHGQIMSGIENILHRIHQIKRQSDEEEEAAVAASTLSTSNHITATTDAASRASNNEPTRTENHAAYAIVNAVAPESPAYSAGLRRNDRIVLFGHITATNLNSLQALNVLISQAENQELNVTVLRDGRLVEMLVTPKSGWGGRGTLGCHLLPV